MPYIKLDERNNFDPVLESLPRINTKGQLAYCVFKLMIRYMKDREYRYSNLHDCVYAAMHCADEFRRRFLDAREDKAMEDNGDIY